MDANTILANPDIIRLESIISEPNAITVVVHAKQKKPCCPKCGQPSVSLHSHYRRAVSDLPWHNVAVKLQLNTRKFRCRNELCSGKIFCERLPEVVETHARKSCRLDSALTWLALALGGEAGARTAQRLQIETSGDTLLRMIRRATLPPPSISAVANPKVIGVDDWAWRKGCTYGTIIVDLERRKVIDLLPDREAGTLTDWLLAHPSVETVARDRSITYRNGIMMGKPYATQVADRWHLLSNLGEAVEKIIERLLRKRKTVDVQAVELSILTQPESCQKGNFEMLDDWQWNRDFQDTYRELKTEACRRRLLPHLPVVSKPETVRQEIRLSSAARRPTRNKELSPRFKLDVKTLRGLFFRKGKLAEEELGMLCDARAEWDEFDRAYPLAEEFVKIIRRQSSMPIGLWIVKAFDCGVKELRSFANGLQKDFLAVREATTSPWSNGQTEGQVNRLKLLKRQMYGRANFDLLKARVLNPA